MFDAADRSKIRHQREEAEEPERPQEGERDEGNVVPVPSGVRDPVVGEVEPDGEVCGERGPDGPRDDAEECCQAGLEPRVDDRPRVGAQEGQRQQDQRDLGPALPPLDSHGHECASRAGVKPDVSGQAGHRPLQG